MAGRVDLRVAPDRQVSSRRCRQLLPFHRRTHARKTALALKASSVMQNTVTMKAADEQINSKKRARSSKWHGKNPTHITPVLMQFGMTDPEGTEDGTHPCIAFHFLHVNKVNILRLRMVRQQTW